MMHDFNTKTQYYYSHHFYNEYIFSYFYEAKGIEQYVYRVLMLNFGMYPLF